jgi:4a-hydroxytetrahydrobiopterin dehydratase
MRNLTSFRTFESQESLDLPMGWSGSEESISREFQFKDFLRAMGFLNGVAEVANRMDHHPKMTIDYDKVLVETSTHDAGGVTYKDLDLAGAVNMLYRP